PEAPLTIVWIPTAQGKPEYQTHIIRVASPPAVVAASAPHVVRLGTPSHAQEEPQWIHVKLPPRQIVDPVPQVVHLKSAPQAPVGPQIIRVTSPPSKTKIIRLPAEPAPTEPIVQDFFTDLELFRTRLSDITDVQHVRRAWDGAARYIRAKWANRGLRAESTMFEELKESALDIEQAHKIKRAIEHEHPRRDNHKQNRSCSPDRRKDRKFDKTKQNQNKNTSGQQQSNRKRERSENWKKSKTENKGGQGNKHFNLTDEQKEKYHQEDRCF
ncbi:hypothetical protein FRC11_002077, partial [Ceratobasidium sp. 423]